jgi:pimeloyl-ACP methyl ester carboxylesterase
MVAPRFADRYSVIAFDLRGHGQSSKPDSGYHWSDDYGADIAAYVQQHVEEPAVVIGHSLGAMVTAPVAALVPDRVKAIVMEDPPAFGPTENPEGSRTRFQPVLEMKRMPLEDRITHFMQTASMNKRAATRRAEELGAIHESVLTELIAGNTAFAPADWFPRVQCPALVILGEPAKGGVVAHKDRPRIVELMPRAVVKEWDDVGHLIHFQKMEQFITEVDGFLNRLPV